MILNQKNRLRPSQPDPDIVQSMVRYEMIQSSSVFQMCVRAYVCVHTHTGTFETYLFLVISSQPVTVAAQSKA
jgi:hypothetical protein